jgi:NTE family protein
LRIFHHIEQADINMENNKEIKKFSKIGLALGGGSARGFCHIGVLKVLEEYKIPIHCIAGCSMGAVIGGMYAAGVSVAEMEDASKKITDYTIRDIGISSKKQGIFRGARVMKMLRRYLGVKTFADCRLPFAATAVEIKSAALRVFTDGDLASAIRASVSIPGIFHVAEINGERFFDGHILERLPVSAAKSMGADFVIAVDALGPVRTDYEPKGILDIFERMNLIMDWEANKRRVKSEPGFLITPDQGNRSMRRFKNNFESIRAGEEAARAAMPELLELFSNRSDAT